MFRRSIYAPLLAVLSAPGLLQARPLSVLPFRRMHAVSRTEIKRGRGGKYPVAHLGPNEAATRRHRRAAARAGRA
jgi:hypothetical protein